MAYYDSGHSFGTGRVSRGTPQSVEKPAMTYFSSSSSGPASPGHASTTSKNSWDDYHKAAYHLVHWLRNAIVELSRREFPGTFMEMKDVANNFRKFRSEEVGRKSVEKCHIANLFDDLQDLSGQLPIKREYHLSEIEKLWNEFVIALQEKDSAIHIELSKLQKMSNLANKTFMECNRCNELIDEMESNIMALKRNTAPAHLWDEVRQIQSDVVEIFRLMSFDLQKLREGNSQEFNQLSKSVQCVKDRYINLEDYISSVQSSTSSVSSPPPSGPPTVFATQKLQNCYNWLKSKEDEMENIGYGRDMKTSSDCLEMQKKCHQEIKQFQNAVQECIGAKQIFPSGKNLAYNKQLSQIELGYTQLLSTSNFRLSNLQSLVSFLKEATNESDWIKRRECETTDSVSSPDDFNQELENLKMLGKELKGRENSFISLLEKGEDLARDQHPASNVLEFYCNLLRAQWTWLLQLSNCMEIHSRNISLYQQFHATASEVGRWTSKQLNLVNELSLKQTTYAPKEAEKILKALSEVKKSMRHYENVIYSLESQSEDIPAIKFRSQSLSPNTNIEAICSYKLSNVAVEKGEKCILLSDSLSSKWKIRNSSGMEAILPSACFVLLPPNHEALNLLKKIKSSFNLLKDKLESFSYKVFQNVVAGLVQKVKSLTLPQYQALRADERSMLRTRLNEESHYLASNFSKDDPNFMVLYNDLQNCCQILDKFDSHDAISGSEPNTSTSLLRQLDKLIQAVYDLENRIDAVCHESFYPKKSFNVKRQISDIEERIDDIRPRYEDCKQKYESMSSSRKTVTLDDMHAKVIEKFDRVLLLSSFVSQRLEATLTFEGGKSEVLSFINEMENLLKKLSYLTADVSQLRETAESLQKFYLKLLQNQHLKDAMEKQVNGISQLLSNKQFSSPSLKSDVNDVQKDCGEAKILWGNLKQQITERKLNIERAVKYLVEYKAKERELNSELNVYEKLFDALNKKSDNEIESTEQLATLLNKVKAFRYELENLNKHGGLFIKEVQIYEKGLEDLIPSRSSFKRIASSETVSNEMNSMNKRYTELLNNLLTALSSRKSLLERLGHQYLLSSEKDIPSLRTFQSETRSFEPRGKFEVPQELEDHFRSPERVAPHGGSEAVAFQSAKQLGKSNNLESYPTKPSYYDKEAAVHLVAADDGPPREEHMHSEDMEEFVQPIKDGEEKITKHTKQEFHSRKTAFGFESLSTHEKKLLSLVSTEASDYSGKIKFPLSIDLAVQYKLFNAERGCFIHPESSEKMSLKDAIEKSFLNADNAIFVCPTSSKPYSLKDAITSKLLDANGCFTSLDGDFNFNQLLEGNFINLKNVRTKSVKKPENRFKEIKKSVEITPKKRFYAITSAVDPCTKRILDAFSAVQQGVIDQANALYNGVDGYGNVVKIPICDAIHLGLVFLDENDFSGNDFRNKLIQETKTFNVTGVIDPVTRKKLTLFEAVNSGYVDQVKGLFNDPIKNKSIPIVEAIGLGHVLADVTTSTNDGIENSKKKISTSKEVAFTISSVFNAYSGKEINISDAIKLGIFDPSLGEYKNLKTGEKMSLNEAIEKGFVKIVQGKPEVKETPREEKVSSIHIDDELDAREEMAHEEIIEERKTFQITGVKEMTSGKFITFGDAVAHGIIDEGRGLYVNTLTNQRMTVPEALEKGFIIGTMQMIGQQELFKSAVVALQKDEVAAVYSPLTDSLISASEAIQLGLLSRDMKSYFDPRNNKVYQIVDALSLGFIKTKVQSSTANKKNQSDKEEDAAISSETKVHIDWSGGNVVNSATRGFIPISEALKFGLIDDCVAAILRMKNPEKNVEKIVEKEEEASVSLKMVVEMMFIRDESGRIIIEDESSARQTSCGHLSFVDSESTGGGLSFYDAVKLGLFNVHKGVYFDPLTQKTLSLKDSINAGIINPSSAAVKDLISGEVVSLNELMKNNIIDLSSGKISFSKFSTFGIASDPVFVNSLQRTINLEDAIRCGLFDDESGLFKVPFTDKTLSLKSAIHSGYISGDANVVLNPLNGERLLLSQAVESNVINGDTGKFVDSTLEKNITLSKSFIIGLIKHAYQNNCSVVMDWETGELFSLEDCIGATFVNQSVSCVYDPSSNGRISLKSSANIGLIDAGKMVYVNPLTSDEIPISAAAKLGLISFPGAPILSIPEAATGDITQTHLQTNVSLLKGARLLENITETSSFDDHPLFASRRVGSSAIKKLSDNPTEVTFERNEPNKKFFETKTFDTNTDETPVTMTVTKEGNLLSTHKIVGKVQKTQIKETIESHGDDVEFGSNFSSAASTQSDVASSKQIAEHAHNFEVPPIPEKRSSASHVGNVPRSYDPGTFADLNEKPRVPSYRSVVDHEHHKDLGAGKKIDKQPLNELKEVEDRRSVNVSGQGNFIPNNPKNDTPQNKAVSSSRGLHSDNFENESKMKTKITINDALVKGLLIIPLSKVRHFVTGQHLTLEDAVNSDYLDLDRSVIIDPGSSRPRAASELVDSQIFSVENAVMKNLVSKKLMTLSEMVSQKFIPSYNLPDVEEVQVLTYKEAVLCGLLDEMTNQYFEPVTKVIINVETAYKIGYIEHDPLDRMDADRKTHAIPRTKPVPLLDAFKKGCVNPETFVFTSPSTGEKCHFNNAISRGWIVVPEFDGSDSNVEGVDFEAAFRQGYIDIKNNIFIDPITEVLVPLDAAIKKGYILLPMNGARVNGLELDDETLGGKKQFSSKMRFFGFPDLPLQFEDALTCGLYDETSGTFSDPRGYGSLTIEDAIQSNLIDSSSKVKSPVNGMWMSLERAMRDGHIDSLSGKFINQAAFSAIPTKEAFELGLLKSLGPCTWIGTSLNDYLRKCLQSGCNILVFNPLSQAYTSLSHAHKLGIVDLNKNVYYDSTTNKNLTFEDAVQQHLLLIDSEFHRDQFDVVSFEIKEVYDSLNNKWIPPSLALKLEILDTNSNLYIDSSSAKEMGLFDALKLNKIKVKEIIDVNSVPSVDRVFSIKRVVDLVNNQEIDPQLAGRKGIIDMKEEVYCDFLNKSKISLYGALLSDLIQAEELDARSFRKELQTNEIEEVMDYTTGVKWTLTEAMENNLIDDTASYYIDPRSGEKLSLRHAWEEGYVMLKSDDRRGFQSKTIKSVIDPRTGEEIPISDAVRHRIVDKVGGKFWNMKTNAYMDLDYAVTKGFVLTESTEKAIEKLALVEVDDYLGSNAKVYLINSVRDPGSDKEYNPVEAERRGYINKVKGIYMNLVTGEQISIKEAITSGYVRASEVEEPDYEALKEEDNVYAVFESNKSFKEISSVVDPSTNEKISLIEGVRRGILDLKGNAQKLNNDLQRIANGVHQPERFNTQDESYTFKVRAPVFFTVIQKNLNYQAPAPPTPETFNSKRTAFESSSNQKREDVHVDPVSNKPKSITEPKRESKPAVERPTTINKHSETSCKSSTNSSSQITRSYSDHLSSVKGEAASKHSAPASEAVSKKQMSSSVAVQSSYSVVDHGASKTKQAQKNSSNDSSNHCSTVIPLPLTSKDDFESLDQLLAELEQGSTPRKRHVDDSLLIDENLIRQSNKWDKLNLQQQVDSSISSDTEFFSARDKQKHSDSPSKSNLNSEGWSCSNSDLTSEDLAGDLFVREDLQDTQQNFDWELRSSTGRSVSQASTSDTNREQGCTLDELVKLNLYNKSKGTVSSPDGKKEYPLLEAIERGIVLKNSVKLWDPTSNKLITLAEASERGIMNPENGSLHDVYNKRIVTFIDSVNIALDMKNNQLKVACKKFTLNEAVDKYFDKLSRSFKFPDVEYPISLKNAIEYGHIETNEVTLKMGTSGDRVLFDSLIKQGLVDLIGCSIRNAQGKNTPLEEMLRKSENTKPNSFAYLYDNGFYSPESNKFRDPETGELVSIGEAINRNILDHTSLLFSDPSTNEILGLKDAILSKLIDSNSGLVKNSMSIIDAFKKSIIFAKPLTLSKAVEFGLFNETTGKLLDPSHRKFFTLKEATQNGLIDENSQILDPFTKKILTFSQAVSEGLLDYNTGTMTNKATKETMSLKEACMSAKLSKVQTSGVPQESSVLSNNFTGESGTTNVFQTEAGTLSDPTGSSEAKKKESSKTETTQFINSIGKNTNLEKALENHLVDPNSCFVHLPWTGNVVTLQKLIGLNLIDLKSGQIKNPKTGEYHSIFDLIMNNSDESSSDMSLAEAVDSEVFNPETGKVIDPDSGKEMSLLEALKIGLISSQKSIMIIDKDVLNLEQAINNGYVDPTTAETKNHKTGDILSFADAIQTGLLLDVYVPPKYSLEKMNDIGLYNQTKNCFINPFTGKDTNLEDVLAAEIIDPDQFFLYFPDSKKEISLTTASNLKILSQDLHSVTDPLTKKQYDLAEVMKLSSDCKNRQMSAVKSEELDEEVNIEINEFKVMTKKLEDYKGWIIEANQQIGLSHVTANKEDLEREIKRLQQIFEMVSEVRPEITSLQNEIDRILIDKDIPLDKSQFERMKILNNEVKSHSNLLHDNLKNQIKSLMLCYEEFVKYLEEKLKFETWLTAAKDELDSKHSNLKRVCDVKVEKESLKNYVDDVFIRQGDLKYVDICRNQFLDQARHFQAMQMENKHLKRSSSQLDLLSSLTDDMKQLSNEYSNLRNRASSCLDKLEFVNDSLKRFEAIEYQIKHRLLDISKSLDDFSNAEIKQQPNNDNLKIINNGLNDLQSLSLLLEKVETSGMDVVTKLKQFGPSDAVQSEISERLQNLKQQLSSVEKDLQMNRNDLQRSLNAKQSMANDLERLSDWVGSADSLVRELEKKELTLDQELVMGKLNEIKVLESEISTLSPTLSSLIESVSQDSLNSTIQQIDERYKDVLKKFKKKEKQFEDIASFLNGFHSDIKSLKSWMNKIIGDLEIKDIPIEKLEAIQEEIKSKNEEFSNLQQNLETFVKKYPISSKGEVEELICEHKNSLQELENLCLSQLSQESTRLQLENAFEELKNEVLNWIVEMENGTDAFDWSLLGNLDKDGNTFINKLLEDHHSFKDSINELDEICLNISKLTAECDRTYTTHQKLKRYLKRGLRSPSPLTVSFNPFQFGDEVPTEHQRVFMELNTRYELVGEKLELHKQQLTEQINVLKSLEKECSDLSDWMENAESLFKVDLVLPSSEVEMQLENKKLQDWRLKIFRKESEILNAKLRLKNFMETSGSPHAGEISKKIQEIDEQWKNVQKFSEDFIQSYHELVDDLKVFRSCHGQLMTWLSLKDRMITTCLASLGLDRDILKCQMNQIELLQEESKSEQVRYDLFLEKGHRLIDRCATQSGNVEEISSWLDEVSTNWEKVKSKLTEKHSTITNLLEKRTSLGDKVNQLIDNIKDTTDWFHQLEVSDRSLDVSQIKSKMRPMSEKQVYLKAMLDDVMKLAEDLYEVSEGPNLKIQMEVASAEKAYKDFTKTIDSAQTLLASMKSDEQKTSSSLLDASTWIDGMITSLRSLCRLSSEPNEIMLNSQLFQNLKENVCSKKDEIQILLESSQKVAATSDDIELTRRISRVISKWDEIQNSCKSFDDKMKMVAEKAGEYLSETDHLLLWMKFITSKQLSRSPVADLDSLKRRLNETQQLESEFDVRYKDFENLKLLSSELEGLTGSRSESVSSQLKEIENFFNVSMKENESNLNLLEGTQEKLDEFKEFLDEFESCILEKEEVVARDHVTSAYPMKDVKVEQLKETLERIVDDLSRGEYLHEEYLEGLRIQISELVNRKNSFEKLIEEAYKKSMLAVEKSEVVLKEADSIEESLLILEDCIKSNFKSSSDSNQLKEHQKNLLVLEKQNKTIEMKIKTLESSTSELEEKDLISNKEIILQKLDQLNRHCESSSSSLCTLQKNVSLATCEVDSLNGTCGSVLKEAESALRDIVSLQICLSEGSISLEQLQESLENLQTTSLKHVQTGIEKVKRQRQQFLNSFASFISGNFLEEKLTCLDEMYNSLNEKVAQVEQNLSSCLLKQGNFFEAAQLQLSQLSHVEEMIANISSNCFDLTSVDSQIHVQKEAHTMLKNLEKNVLDIEKMGEEVGPRLSEKERKDVENQIENIKKKWNELFCKSLQNVKDLEMIKTMLADYNKQFDAFATWLSSAESGSLVGFESLDLTENKNKLDQIVFLSKEIENQKVCLDDLFSMVAVLEIRLPQSTEQLDYLNKNLNHLRIRFVEVEDQSAATRSTFEEGLELLGQFNEMYSKLDKGLEEFELQVFEEYDQLGHQQLQHFEEIVKQYLPDFEHLNKLNSMLKKILSGQVVQQVSQMTSAEINRYEKVITHLNQKAEKLKAQKTASEKLVIETDRMLERFKDFECQLSNTQLDSIEPDDLREQLTNHKDVHEKVLHYKNESRSIISAVKRQSRLLDINQNLDAKVQNLPKEIDFYYKLSTIKMHILEQALPLALQFHETRCEVSNFLSDFQNNLKSLDSPSSVSQKHHHDAAKNLKQQIVDQRFLFDRFNKSAFVLGRQCSDKKKEEIQLLVDSVNKKYNALKTKCQSKLNDLEKVYFESAQMSDKIEDLSELFELSFYQIKSSESVSCLVEKLRDQIEDVATIEECIKSKSHVLQSVLAAQPNLVSGDSDQQNLGEREQVAELRDMHQLTMNEAAKRSKDLENTLSSSECFWQMHGKWLNDANQLEDLLIQHFDDFNEAPITNLYALQEHQAFIKDLKANIDKLSSEKNDLIKKGNELKNLAKESDENEIADTIDSVECQLANLSELHTTIISSVNEQLGSIESLKAAINKNLECLHNCEQSLDELNQGESDDVGVKMKKHQIKQEIVSKLNEVHRLKISTKDLMVENKSFARSSQLIRQLNDFRTRWLKFNDVVSKQLNNLEMSELDESNLHAFVEKLLQWSEVLNKNIDTAVVQGSLPSLMLQLNSLELLQMDVANHQPAIRKVFEAAEGIKKDQITNNLSKLKKNIDNGIYKLKSKQKEFDENQSEAKTSDIELDDIVDKLDKIEKVAKSHNTKHSKTPTSVQNQLQELQTQLKAFNAVETKSEILMASFLLQQFDGAEDDEEERNYTKRRVELLNRKGRNARQSLKDWEKMLEEARLGWESFEKSHSHVTELIGMFEDKLKTFIPIRRTRSKCSAQIQSLQSLKDELNGIKDSIKNLGHLASSVKHTSDKAESLIVKKVMSRVDHSFKNTRRKFVELSTLTNRALKQAIAFENVCSAFIDSIKDISDKLELDCQQDHQKNITLIKKQIEQHTKFQQLLGLKQSDYDNILSQAKSLSSRSCYEDQQIIDQIIMEVRNYWTSLCHKSVKRQNNLEESLLECGELKEKVRTLRDWLKKMEPTLMNQQNICGDLEFVTELEEEHYLFLEELSNRSSAVDEFCENFVQSTNSNNRDKSAAADDDDDNDDENNLLQAEILELKYQLDNIQSLATAKAVRIKQALDLAKNFDEEAENLVSWLETAEEGFHPYKPDGDNEEFLLQKLKENETFKKMLNEKKTDVEKFNQLANNILMHAHPDVFDNLSVWIKNFKSRLENLYKGCQSNGSALESSLEETKKCSQQLEHLISWLVETENKLKADDDLAIVENLPIVEQLYQDFELLEAEIQSKQAEFDQLTRISRQQGESTLQKKFKKGKDGRKTPEPKLKSERVGLLFEKWRQVWMMTIDRRRRLQDIIDKLNEVEHMKNFSPDQWMGNYFKWMNQNPSRILELFRRRDKKYAGKISKKDFVEVILESEFQSPDIEIQVVADIFDRDGFINYKEFVNALKSEMIEQGSTMSENEKICNEIERQAGRCNCKNKYLISKLADGKYKFGLSEKLRLVRIQRSCVMVRVGGGWMSLEEFLLKNDPCRARRKTSPDLREQFSLAEGVSQSMATFRSKSPQNLLKKSQAANIIQKTTAISTHESKPASPTKRPGPHDMLNTSSKRMNSPRDDNNSSPSNLKTFSSFEV